MTWKWISPRADADELRGSHWTLRRRGVHHGYLQRVPRASVDAPAVLDRWLESEPVHLPGVLRPELTRMRREVARSRAMFTRLQDGGSFVDEVWRRLAQQRRFQDAGVSSDLSDVREIETIHLDGPAGARDLYAKLSWISLDERDPSLRIRFSFGSERMDAWRRDTTRSVAADHLCEAVFPESRILSRNRKIHRRLQSVLNVRYRLSERIVYANAPGGGAVFHHDAEPGQLGVVFGQFQGSTAWLALSKRRLAGLLRDHAGTRRFPSVSSALRAIDRGDRPEVARWLNRTPAFTRRLVDAGACIVLRAGDALLLPSNGPDDVAWHSVFALGRGPSLGHSYGVYPDRRRA